MLDIPDYYHVFDLSSHEQPFVVYEEELKRLYKQFSLSEQQLELALLNEDVESHTHRVRPMRTDVYIERD
ncbi:hypothetical protein amad1_22058 (plasmid) [Alteromonas mediterranea DE1]|uniref:Uncharacterized protein n=1 Tax=Alteromonas mediterranea TaxID=314275 RepID=A0AAC8XPM5_9ALTE|nr:hypothetical protein amad1_22058 [Alteromonas mediterranea DE1]AGP87888.1 hypothetical protein I607_20787 [Alteromonas mediterranea U4]AGP99869.1 hypothetical protein I635_22074 [Alteromonas mediterranea UM7]AMJ80936.1 hypothetical protein AV942_21395 [Alteromonas mediterranea]AUI84882.1 hypothetical protein TE101_21225 [Alteromonas macleodii]PTT93588.1 hypothetical protein DBR45_52555 [Pseudomonas sp. HMWF031]